MAIKKKGLNLAGVARAASENFVSPTPLEPRDEVRERVRQEVEQEEKRRIEAEKAAKEERKSCIIPKTGGFPIYLEPADKKALSCILAFNEVDKQNVVRTAVHLFLQKYYTQMGLTEEGVALVQEYMETIYK